MQTDKHDASLGECIPPNYIQDERRRIFTEFAESQHPTSRSWKIVGATLLFGLVTALVMVVVIAFVFIVTPPIPVDRN